MTVTALKREKGHIVRLEFENGESLVLDCDVAFEECIHEDDDLSPERIKGLKEKSDYIRAKSRALWLLDRYTYTERKLKEKLIASGFPPKAVTEALDRLKSLGVISDEELSLRYAKECAQRGISKRAAYAKLLARGFDNKTVKSALDNTDFDEQDQIRTLIERKYGAKISAGETEKVYAALIRKGFSYSAVREALKSYSKDLENIGDE